MRTGARRNHPAWLTTALLAAAFVAPGLALAQKENRVNQSPVVEKPVKDREVAVLAGGCFWGMQDILRKIPGVLETQAGYTGGWLANPRYDDTHDSKSGHAESVRVVFDPRLLSYEDLLEKWFFRMHDPTTLNRQGNDVGTQYRSAIFYEDETQRATAEKVKARVQASGHWKGKIVTEIAKASTWYPAEDYHQDYLVKHPGGYTCHFLRSW
jgi:methionine-S-sulfoxide reductase